MLGQFEFVQLDTTLYDRSYIIRNTYIAVFNTELSAEPAYLVSSGIEKPASWEKSLLSFPLLFRPGTYTAFNILHSVLEFEVKELHRQIDFENRNKKETIKIDSSFNNGEHRIPSISKSANLDEIQWKTKMTPALKFYCAIEILN